MNCRELPNEREKIPHFFPQTLKTINVNEMMRLITQQIAIHIIEIKVEYHYHCFQQVHTKPITTSPQSQARPH